MTRYHRLFLFLLLLLSLTVLWAFVDEKRKPYRQYQKIYQRQKLGQLQAQIASAQSPEQREELAQQAEALQDALPAVQELLLPDGRRERCTSCHIGIEEISSAHPVETFGCTLCHGGDPLSVTLPAAHAGLIGGRNPSDFTVIDQSCGRTMADGTACHNGDKTKERDHIHRVRTTIMATKAGEFAHTRYTFGAQKDLTARYGVTATEGNVPDGRGAVVPFLEPLPYSHEADLPVTEGGALLVQDLTGKQIPISGHRTDTLLQENCARACHLWTPGEAEPYLNRASGCAACHYLYDDHSVYRGDDPTIRKNEPGHGPRHQLTLKIPYSQCNHCHNRGNHSLLTMKFEPRDDLADLSNLSDEARRIRDYYNPMSLFTRCEHELDCIDCHTDREVMGDGFIYNDKKAQQRVRCYTCHGTLDRPPVIRVLSEKEAPKIQRIMRSYGRKAGEQALFSREGEILPHVRFGEEGPVLTGKVTNRTFVLPLVYGSRCTQNPEKQDADSCHGCHDINLEAPTPY
ncbi:MAG: hypothetical protein R3231_08150 [bacterium]|nr:hypothetical protein [bacterium]